jgi:hypothetical protein
MQGLKQVLKVQTPRQKASVLSLPISIKGYLATLLALGCSEGFLYFNISQAPRSRVFLEAWTPGRLPNVPADPLSKLDAIANPTTLWSNETSF